MNFSQPYVILRVEPSGKAVVLHSADNIKDARYWLNYIAQPGDAIFTTPAHPKYSGQGELQYMAHLVARKKMSHEESVWKKERLQNGAVLSVMEPAEEQAKPAEPEKTSPKMQQALDGAGKPHQLTLADLQQLYRKPDRNFEIVLVDAQKWIDWESALTLMMRDTILTGIDPAAKWPIRVTHDPKKSEGEWIGYNPEMRFTLKKRER